MKYLIVQEWPNTKGNHAGMSHMCDLLVLKYPNQYTKITKDTPPEKKRYNNKFLNRLLTKYIGWKYRKNFVADYMQLCDAMFKNLKAGDEVFLLEYNWPATSQYEIAYRIRKEYPGVRIYAMSHLTPSYFSKLKNIKKLLLHWDKLVDKHLTLGSSLSTYFKQVGIDDKKISTGFHYVDRNYYQPQDLKANRIPTIIAMGFLQRDFAMLAEIVNRCTDVHWIICRGRKVEVDCYFTDNENVVLKGFMDETELRRQMSFADASLNVMEDTVGSNVITTSMAMGLIVIASNVGSIHDYCNNDNAIFCENSVESFLSGIERLKKIKPEQRLLMRQASVSRSSLLTIDMVNKWFNTLKY
jgi:glycosyltransferase involved in cell wall biosynthesis